MFRQKPEERCAADQAADENTLTPQEALRIQQDMLFIDSHGITHPRRLGIAKSIPYGTYEEPAPEKGGQVEQIRPTAPNG